MLLESACENCSGVLEKFEIHLIILRQQGAPCCWFLLHAPARELTKLVVVFVSSSRARILEHVWLWRSSKHFVEQAHRCIVVIGQANKS